VLHINLNEIAIISRTKYKLDHFLFRTIFSNINFRFFTSQNSFSESLYTQESIRNYQFYNKDPSFGQLLQCKWLFVRTFPRLSLAQNHQLFVLLEPESWVKKTSLDYFPLMFLIFLDHISASIMNRFDFNFRWFHVILFFFFIEI